ncbi:hypothetical protein KEJ17_04215 [Candidatus Bathyarchaeota archaeon]|nr:hypothetical protein [Candidatus Bathyarchaeota archaeon]
MDIPSQVLAQFVLISAIVLITAYYLHSISLYTSFLRERELEVAAYKIERQILEAVNEAIKSKNKIVRNAMIGSLYRGKIINWNGYSNLSLSEGDMVKEIILPATIGLEGSEDTIRITYKPTSFATYNVMIIVEYIEKEKTVNVQLG